MQFYDGEGAIWTATVDISDLATGSGSGNLGFTVEQLKDISVSPTTISFGTISIGSTNTVSSADSVVTNNGNYDVPADGELTISSAALVGETNPAQTIPNTNFKSSATSDFSNFCGSGTNLGGVALDGTPINIPSDSLPKGAASTGSYRHCLVSHSVTEAQVYSTTAGGTPWVFAI